MLRKPSLLRLSTLVKLIQIPVKSQKKECNFSRFLSSSSSHTELQTFDYYSTRAIDIQVVFAIIRSKIRHTVMHMHTHSLFSLFRDNTPSKNLKKNFFLLYFYFGLYFPMYSLYDLSSVYVPNIKITLYFTFFFTIFIIYLAYNI